METLEMEYRVNEQGMILEYFERTGSSINRARSLSSDNIGFITSHQSDQNLIVREDGPA